MVEIDRSFATWNKLVNHVRGNIAEQQVTGLALLHPNRPLGEAKAAFDGLNLRIGIEQFVEDRIEPDNISPSAAVAYTRVAKPITPMTRIEPSGPPSVALWFYNSLAPRRSPIS